MIKHLNIPRYLPKEGNNWLHSLLSFLRNPQWEQIRTEGQGDRGEKDGFWCVTDPQILSSKRKMKVRKGTQGNKKKNYQADDGANEEIEEEGKRHAERKRKRQWTVGELSMPGEEGWISGPMPLCRLNHRRFLVPQAGLYKAQTDAGFSTLLLWNWIIMKPDHGFRHDQLASRGELLSQVTGHLSSFACCCSAAHADHSVIERRGVGGHLWTLGVCPNPPLLCCARGGRAARPLVSCQTSEHAAQLCTGAFVISGVPIGILIISSFSWFGF